MFKTQGSNSALFYISITAATALALSIQPVCNVYNYKGYFMGRIENVHNKLIKWLLPLKVYLCVQKLRTHTRIYVDLGVLFPSP